MKSFNIEVSRYFSSKVNLGELLTTVTKLDPTLLSDAAIKGAVWIQKEGKGKILKIREVASLVDPKDKVQFYYEPAVLKLRELTLAQCIEENRHYGIWIKPQGAMSQGTQAADHASLLRYIEKKKNHEIYLVHRLDRETEGVMVFGYTSEGAAKLSELFQKNEIHKTYQALVLGEMVIGSQGVIEASLDGKVAVTHYQVMDSRHGLSKLELKIETGRLHQIRRHLESIGHPVMGDPKYGKGNKNQEGLKLLAKSLNFKDPWDKKSKSWALTKDLTL